MRKDFLGLWLAQDKKAIFIEKGKQGFFDTVKAALNGLCYKRPHLYKIGSKTLRMKAVWNITDKEYPFLQVEAGAEGLGPTYHLVFVIKNPNGNEPEYILAKDNDTLDKIIALPEVQIGLYDDWDDDLGVPWAKPLLPLKRALRQEEKEFLKLHHTGGFFCKLLHLQHNKPNSTDAKSRAAD